jgi:hypothetical protein
MLQPVNRLPPEILSRIVRYVPNYCALDASSMVPLTHVCRYWREVVISTPCHWTLISSKSRSFAAASLERAKSALLKITLDPSPFRRDHPLSGLLIPYIQNTKILNVGRLSAVELKKVLPNFPQSMPNLQTLTLNTKNAAGWDQSIDPFESFPPTLRYLELVATSLYPSLLKLRTLVELDLHDRKFNLHLDALLDFLGENHSLESVILDLNFRDPSLRTSRRRAAIETRLRYLKITCFYAMDGQGLISGIALPKGAELRLFCCPFSSTGVMVNDVLSGISITHLSNLQSPTFMEYQAHMRLIRLLGSNGSATLIGRSPWEVPFVEFPSLPLTNIRRLHLDTRTWDWLRPRPGPAVFHHLSFFPILETLTIECDADLSRLLSPLLSNPSSSPSLKTLAFLGCIIAEDFMGELTQFASNRKNTTSTRLYRVVILNWQGIFPSVDSIGKLGEHVPIVDVGIAEELPADLT